MTRPDVMPRQCACATHPDGSVTTMLCPVHADTDPCLTMARVTGRRRKGTIRRGVCSHCGHGGAGRTTVDLRPGDRVRVARGVVRTVASVAPNGYANGRGEVLYTVRYLEGATPEWGPGNSGAPGSMWELATGGAS